MVFLQIDMVDQFSFPISQNFWVDPQNKSKDTNYLHVHNVCMYGKYILTMAYYSDRYYSNQTNELNLTQKILSFHVHVNCKYWRLLDKIILLGK